MPRETDRWALDLFEQWLEADPADSQGWIARQCGDDPALAQALSRLIAAHQHANLLPTMPAAPLDPRALAEPPERIGPWRLTGVIGQGGMGTVYRAERADGLFAQTAAIKLMRPGLFSARSERQFARERGILAALQHPHIARLYDGGTSEDGLSYFVMELIAGVPITRHCHDAGLDLPARVALLLPLCDAVQYAHQRLVVHADIKPGNVLVDPQHGVKLLDFGISRLSDEAEEGSQRSGLSPRYASPQLLAGARAVAADDIFATGVLLAEMTADMPPDAELAAVIAKASASLAADRYAAIGDVAADLQRWLNGFPVRALPRSRKRDGLAFVRRHRLAVAASALAISVLLVLTVASTVLYLRAEARFAETRALSRFLLDDVVTGIEPLPGSGEIRRRIAERARGSLERLSQVPGASDELQADLGEAYARVGQILTASELRDVRGSGRLGVASLIRAQQLLRARLVEEPERKDLWLVLARTLAAHAGYALDNASDQTRAAALLQQARSALGRAGAAAAPDRLIVDLEIAIVDANLAYNRTDYPAMESLARRALAAAETARPRSGEQRVQLALRQDRLWALVGDARWYGADDKQGALVAYSNSMAALNRVAGLGDIRVVKRQSFANYNVSSTMFELGRPQEAVAMMEQAVEAARRMRLFDGSVDALHQQAVVSLEYALQLEALGRLPVARRYALETIAVRREALALEPDSYAELRALPVALVTTGQLFRGSGSEAQGCGMLHEADSRLQDLEQRGMLTQFDRDEVWAQARAGLTTC